MISDYKLNTMIYKIIHIVVKIFYKNSYRSLLRLTYRLQKNR